MNRFVVIMAVCVCAAGNTEAGPEIRTDVDRVKAPLSVDLPLLGTLKARTAAEIGEAGWDG